MGASFFAEIRGTNLIDFQGIAEYDKTILHKADLSAGTLLLKSFFENPFLV